MIGRRQATWHADWPKFENRLSNGTGISPETAYGMGRREYLALIYHPEFSKKFLGAKGYNDFKISAGYTDYENADTKETLYNYGMDDNQTGWTALSIPWRQLVLSLCEKIGWEHFRFSQKVAQIEKTQDNSSGCLFEIETEKRENLSQD